MLGSALGFGMLEIQERGVEGSAGDGGGGGVCIAPNDDDVEKP